jgi:ATP-dependent HslUV protease ATP-binding subunit HslU
MTRERKRKDVEAKAELAAEERVLDALVGANASADDPRSVPQEAARRRARRQGDRDRGAGAAAAACRVRDSRHAGRADGRDQSRRHARQGFGGGAPRRAHDRAGAHEILLIRGSRQAARQEQLTQEAIAHVENNGIVFIDEIDKICAARRRAAAADVSRARACSATCCR